jgi:hypothetical protein
MTYRGEPRRDSHWREEGMARTVGTVRSPARGEGEETGMNGHRFRRLGAVAVLALMLPFGLPASPLAAADLPLMYNV